MHLDILQVTTYTILFTSTARISRVAGCSHRPNTITAHMLIAIQADRKFYGNEYYEIQMTIVNIFKFIVPLVKVVQLFMPLVDSHFTSMHNFGERD